MRPTIMSSTLCKRVANVGSEGGFGWNAFSLPSIAATTALGVGRVVGLCSGSGCDLFGVRMRCLGRRVDWGGVDWGGSRLRVVCASGLMGLGSGCMWDSGAALGLGRAPADAWDARGGAVFHVGMPGGEVVDAEEAVGAPAT